VFLDFWSANLLAAIPDIVGGRARVRLPKGNKGKKKEKITIAQNTCFFFPCTETDAFQIMRVSADHI